MDTSVINLKSDSISTDYIYWIQVLKSDSISTDYIYWIQVLKLKLTIYTGYMLKSDSITDWIQVLKSDTSALYIYTGYKC